MYYSKLCDEFPILDEMGWKIPEELDGRFRLKTFPAHHIIHQKDSLLDQIGILLYGSFRVVNEMENGNLFMIEINDPVSFTGEVALLSENTTTSVTLETITACRIAFLPHDIFDKWLDKDVRLLRYVSSGIAKKLYSTSYHRGERMFYSTKYVMLDYIIKMYEKSEDETVLIRKTRQQMCEEIGLSVNTIDRRLTSFREEGLISLEKGKISMDPEQYLRARKSLAVYRAENRNGMRTPEE